MKKLLLLLGLSCAMLAGAEAIQDEPLIPDYLKVTIDYSGIALDAPSYEVTFTGSATGIVSGTNINNLTLTQLSDGSPVTKAFRIYIRDILFDLESHIHYPPSYIEDEHWIGTGYDYRDAYIEMALTEDGKTWRLCQGSLPLIRAYGSMADAGLLCGFVSPGRYHDLKLNLAIEDGYYGGGDYLKQDLNSFPRLTNYFDFKISGSSEETLYDLWNDSPYSYNQRSFTISVESLTTEEARVYLENK